MEREHPDASVITLGTASTDTLGQLIPTPVREESGYFPMGLLED